MIPVDEPEPEDVITEDPVPDLPELDTGGETIPIDDIPELEPGPEVFPIHETTSDDLVEKREGEDGETR